MTRRCSICTQGVDLANTALRMFVLYAARLREDVSGAVRQEKPATFQSGICGGCFEEVKAFLVELQNRQIGASAEPAVNQNNEGA